MVNILYITKSPLAWHTGDKARLASLLQQLSSVCENYREHKKVVFTHKFCIEPLICRQSAFIDFLKQKKNKTTKKKQLRAPGTLLLSGLKWHFLLSDTSHLFLCFSPNLHIFSRVLCLKTVFKSILLCYVIYLF